MRKRAASAQGETTPASKVSGGKRLKWSSPDEEAQRSLVVIVEEPPKVDNVVGEAPFVERVVVPSFSARQFNLVIGGLDRPRGPDKLVLNSPVKPMKWDHPLKDATTLSGCYPVNHQLLEPL